MRKPYTNNPSELIAAERHWIEARRKEASNERPQSETGDLNGLALSGGGIRSATFCLGVLHALERFGLRQEFDYLSTVSGGGYIGSCLTWFTAYLGDGFPFGSKRADHKGLGGLMLAWLRAHGNYLVPGDSSRLWSLIAAILTGTFINLIILLPPLALLMFVLAVKVPLVEIKLFDWTLYAALGLFGLFLAISVFIALFSKVEFGRTIANLIKWRRFSGPILMWSVIIAVVGTIPLAYDWIKFHGALLWSSPVLSLSGLISMWGAWKKRKPGGETSGSTSFFLSLGLTLLIYGVFLAIYAIVVNAIVHRPSGLDMIGLAFLFVISVLLAIFANINRVSMHGFYRDSLTRAYLPYQVAQAAAKMGDGKAEWANFYRDSADQCCWSQIADWMEVRPTSAPYHIINAAQNTVGSRDARLRGRGADNFIFSPYYCGSPSVGWESTACFERGRTNLATSMAISGAAVNPNSFATRSRPVSFLMSLLNVRLGYWIRRPMEHGWKWSLGAPHWYIMMFSEMLGRGLNENERRLHLADGGHFENLGLYELLRRRCTQIVVVDAGADSRYHFSDLAKIIEMARVDFGIRIQIDTTEMCPGDHCESPRCFAKGTIEYGAVDGKQLCGTLLYLKPVMTAELQAEDVKAYDRDHPEFPHESTADQFFDEAQFEAYRELGYQLMRDLCRNQAHLEAGKKYSLEEFLDKLPHSIPENPNH
jgi:hypothetical protein